MSDVSNFLLQQYMNEVGRKRELLKNSIEEQKKSLTIVRIFCFVLTLVNLVLCFVIMYFRFILFD